jgi:hypothetical protein
LIIYKPPGMISMCKEYRCKSVVNHSDFNGFSCVAITVAGQIGPKQNRPQVKSASDQIIVLIWNRHGHECSRIWKLSGNFTLIQCIKKCRDILGTPFFRAEFSLIQSSCRSFIRVIVPYEISKVNFCIETKILVSMSEEI